MRQCSFIYLVVVCTKSHNIQKSEKTQTKLQNQKVVLNIGIVNS